MSTPDAPQLKPTDLTDAPRVAGREYWQSFEHLADSPEIQQSVEQEFAGYDPAEMVSIPRRKFLKYIAASMALAGIGLTGCRRWPKEKIAPYAHKPVGHTPGVVDWYATSFELDGVGSGLLVSSFDGRPVKVEGNPQHPGNRVRSGKWGASSIYAQAQPLTMYDPDRSRTIVDRSGRAGGVARDMAWFEENILPKLQQANGNKTAILAEPTASPTALRLRREVETKLPGTTWYTYSPTTETPRKDAMQVAFGRNHRPIYHLEKAMCVVSFDEDYLGQHPASTRHAADWSVLRASADPEQGLKMSRCYQAEGSFTITGASADVRLPTRPSRIGLVMTGLAAELGLTEAPAGLTDAEAEFAKNAAADLREAGSSGLVAFGGHLPAEAQLLAMAINSVQGSVDKTIRYIEEPIPEAGSIRDLADRMAAGDIETLIILGGNPVYDAPADLEFGERLASVPTSVHLSLYDDETSVRCTCHVPQAHMFEAFGDTKGWDGTIAPVQPLIFPLFGGLAGIEMLAMVGGLEETGSYELVRETMRPVLGEADFDKSFRRVLHNGVVDGGTNIAGSPGLSGAANSVFDYDLAGDVEADGFEVTFSPSGTLYDGRYANNGWLQEKPDSLTTLCWDNAALMNITDAAEAGIDNKDMVSITVDGRSIQMPVYLMPGQPRGTIGLSLGYGRTRAGAIGNAGQDGGGGFDVTPIRTIDHLWSRGGATVTKQGERYPLAMTQNHYLIDNVGFKERNYRLGDHGETGYIVREATFDQHKAFFDDHDHGSHDGSHDKIEGGHGSDAHGKVYPADEKDHTLSLQIFQPPNQFNTPHAWGMTIDMNACTGCGACVVACQSENNIPVVGKDGVMNNREMQWLRIDRYFKAEGEDVEAKKKAENPDVAFQPMMCVHCENAPCEQVCPVAATVHDTEGLNTMVYNRCIGTRYCGNNCPYKVRRFNYLDYHVKDPRGSVLDATYVGIPDQQVSEIDAVKQMVFNPEVSVRMRGIMEKCTYCTQRIKQKTIWRGNRQETIQDYDILTACQQACPTEAIIFGNLNDKDARVTKQQQAERSYELLGQLNVRPRTRYMSKLRNREAMGKIKDAGHDTGDH